jgi:hypothetical protein
LLQEISEARGEYNGIMEV